MSLLTNLISHWKLDEASGAALDAHGSNTLTETGGTIDSATGKLGNGRDFEAGDTEYFEIADNTDLSTGDIDFTFGCWFKVEAFGSFPVIAHKGWQAWSDTSREWVLYIDTATNRLIFAVDVGSDASVTASSFGALSTGVWYYVTGWHDAGNNQIGVSVNGVTNTSAHSTGTQSGTRSFQLGASFTTSQSLYFDGVIDEASFWKKVLTTYERDVLYNGGNGFAYENFGTSSSTAGLHANLISYWALDEAAGLAIDSHGEQHLLETSGTIASTTGKVSNARDFESGDTEYFEKADNSDLSTGNIDFTFACWVNPESLGINNATVAGKWGSGNQKEWRLAYSTSLAKYVFYVSTDGSAEASVASTVVATSLSTWVHLAVRHDSVNDTIAIFVNGTKTSSAHTTGVFDSTSPFRLGGEQLFGTQLWDGLIDEASFWKDALSDDEITWLYNSGSGRNYADLATYGVATGHPTMRRFGLTHARRLVEVGREGVLIS